MKVEIEILSPGFAVTPYDGTVLRVEPANFHDDSKRVVRGFRAVVSASTRWQAGDSVSDRAAVLALGLFDLALRWPSPSTLVRPIGSTPSRSRTVRLESLAMYEIGALLGGGPPLPNSVATVSAEVLERIDAACVKAIGLRVPELEGLLGPLAQASAAAAASRPIDRLVPLWSALQLLHPGMSDLQIVDAIVRGAGFVNDEYARTPSWLGLVRLRTDFARDGWYHSPVRIRLSQKPRSKIDKLSTATVIAYAARSAVAHGHWALAAEDRRAAAKSAEDWLWNLVQRLIEMRLMGLRLSPITPIVSAVTSA